MDGKTPDLEAAYALDGPEANRALYADWAETYDAGFAEAKGYQLHAHVGRTYVRFGGQGPVLDVGAGTGLVGQVLAAEGVGPVAGADLSAEMLAVARGKGVYDQLFEADILAPGTLPKARYAGAVSAGTFTLGHVGPEGLAPVITAVRPGGLLVISVNARHFSERGFERKLAELDSDLAAVVMQEVPIYDDRADPEHRHDMARLLILTRA